MSSNSSSGWGAPPEPAKSLFTDRIRLIGSTTVAGTFYGFMTVLAAACVQVATRGSCHQRSRARMYVLVAYIGLLWLCGTLIIAGSSRQVEDAYVRHRLFGPGPGAYFDGSSPESMMYDIADWLLSVLVHGMMTWRTKITWQTSKLYPWIMSFVALFFLATTVITAVGVVFDILPNHSFFSSPAAARISLPGLLSGTLLSVVNTALMAGRIWQYRRRFKKHIGIPHPRQYTKIAAMVVESCALVTVSDIVFIVLYLLHHPAMFLVIAILPQLQIIGPLLLMLRIARGIAWDATTASTIIAREDVTELGATRRRQTMVAGSCDPSQRTTSHCPKFTRPGYEHERESVEGDDAATYDDTEEGMRSQSC